MNIKMLIIGVLATITVIIVGVISAFMVINSEAPTAKQVMVSSTEDNNKTEKKEELNGWKQEKGNWYFYKDNEKQKNWVQDKNSWYFLGSDEKMRTGWIQDKDEWYYMNEDGTMATNTTIDGCYLGKDGTIEDTPVRQTNQQKEIASENNSGFIIKSSDQAIETIKKNDSIFIKNLQTKLGTYLSLSCYSDNPVIGQGLGEECYGVALSMDGVNEEECTYIVGRRTGNIYVYPHQGTYHYYQIKNNEIVQVLGSGDDWR